MNKHNKPTFCEIFENTNLPNLTSLKHFDNYHICADKKLATIIKDMAKGRGYKIRPIVANTEQLMHLNEEIEPIKLQIPAVEAWKNLRQTIQQAGFDIKVISGFRDLNYQATLFFKEYKESPSIDTLKKTLKTIAPPGYSKHQTGYTVDIAAITTEKEHKGIYKFALSKAYQWLAQNNFENARQHGWLPSYPPDNSKQGPDPEPWEFVYVGIENAQNY